MGLLGHESLTLKMKAQRVVTYLPNYTASHITEARVMLLLVHTGPLRSRVTVQAVKYLGSHRGDLGSVSGGRTNTTASFLLVSSVFLC